VITLPAEQSSKRKLEITITPSRQAARSLIETLTPQDVGRWQLQDEKFNAFQVFIPLTTHCAYSL